MANVSLTTKKFRAAFVTLVEPESVLGGKVKYSVTMLFDKDDDEAMMQIRKAMHDVVKETWGPDKAKWPSTLRNIDFKTYVSPNGKDGWPIRDGDTATWNGFAGCFFIKASCNGEGPKAKPPVVVDRQRRPIMDRGVIEAGMICAAAIQVATYDTNGNRGVTCYLSGVQLVEDDGVRYGSSFNADTAFAAWDDEDEATSFEDEAPF